MPDRLSFLASKWFWLVFLSLLFFFTHRYFFLPGDFHTHDNVHFIRLYDLDKVLKEGQIPPRWLPDLGKGFGYPLFNFYAPLGYYMGEIFHLLGFSIVSSYKLSFALAGLVGMFGMWYLVKQFWGSLPAILATAFWLLLPYRALDLYVRGTLAEYWAMNLLPWLFWAVNQAFQKKSKTSFLLLAFLVFLFSISHNGIVLLGGFWLIVYTLIKLVLSPKRRRYLGVILAALLGLGMAVYFVVPAFFEKGDTQVNTMFSGYYQYYVHFPTLKQLFFSRFWGFGGSNFGPEDKMSFQIGWLHWLSVLCALIVFIFSKRKKIFTFLFFFFSFCLFVFLIHGQSNFIWKKIIYLQYLQFPWRLLSLVGFCGSLLSGFFIATLKLSEKYKYFLVFVLILVALGLYSSYFSPQAVQNITDQYYLQESVFRGQQKMFIEDYLPNQVEKEFNEFYRDPLVLSEVGEAEVIVNKTEEAKFVLNAEAPAEVVIKRFYFPGWQVEIENAPNNFTVNEWGHFVVPVKKGYNRIKIYLTDTKIRKISNFVSLFAWLVFGLIWLTIGFLKNER